MDLIQSGQTSKALILEAEGLVGERVRRMLTELGMATCWVDQSPLFHELRSRLRFEQYVVGVRSPVELESLALPEALKPLVLLVPSSEGEGAAHYRMARPDAVILDRALSDPDALHRALLGGEGEAAPGPSGDLVRQTFEPFGLSERLLEVLNRALLGESSAEIANKLYISDLTVRNHLHTIYERVGVSGRRELLGRFVRGLIEEGHA